MRNELTNHEHYVISHANDVKKLFILESPDSEELRRNYPCAQNTGRKMSKVLLSSNSPESNKALGELIYQEFPSVIPYAVFNTFKFPLNINIDFDTPLTPEKEMWRHLKSYDTVSWKECETLKRKEKRPRHYSNFNKLINILNKVDASVLSDYKKTLEKTISLFPYLEEITICGFIAQSIFMNVFNQEDPGYKRRKPITITDRNVLLYFVNHPSRVKKWDY